MMVHNGVPVITANHIRVDLVFWHPMMVEMVPPLVGVVVDERHGHLEVVVWTVSCVYDVVFVVVQEDVVKDVDQDIRTVVAGMVCKGKNC